MDRDLVERKLHSIDTYLHDLRDLGLTSVEEYVEETRLRYSGERLLTLIVDSAVSVNNEILFDARVATPASYYESFMLLPKAGLVRESIAKQLASLAGLRNRLIHNYEDVDDQIVFNNYARALRLFPQYLAAVRQKLGESAAESGEGE
jgi:uncharacterized protein YutE (UPF0331/DUF86 family)